MIKKLFKFIFYIILLCALVFTVGVFYPSPKAPEVGFVDNMYIRNVNIVDVESGDILPSQNVLIRDGRIVGISSENIRPKNELVIIVEGSDKYLIPGLWDMHTQSLKRSPYIHHPLFIANGVTHLRDLSGCLDNNDAYWACTEDRKRWTRLAEQGKALTPIYHQHSTFPINGGQEIPEKFKDFLKADSTDKAKGLVNFSEMQGSNFIALGPMIKRKPYFSLAVEAAKKGLTLSGNKPFSVSLQESLASYQRSIDESTLFATECYKDINSLRSSGNLDLGDDELLQRIIDNQDQIRCSSLMTLMASSSTWWTPSLNQLKLNASYNSHALQNDERKRYIPLVTRYGFWKIADKKREYSTTNNSKNIHRDLYELSKKQAGLANLTGIRMLTGTNSMNNDTYSGFSLHDELSDLVDTGLTPLQALRAASYNPAVFSDASLDYGSIKVGKYADVILLDANPLENINNTKKINSIITQHTYYDREALDELLKFGEKQAKSWHMNIKLIYDAVKSPLMRYQLKQDYYSLKQSKQNKE